MKEKLDRYTTLIIETYKAHSLDGESTYIKALQKYLAAKKAYYEFKKNVPHKSYDTQEVIEADKVRNTFKVYAEAFKNYMQSSTSADCYNKAVFIDYKNYAGFSPNNLVGSLCQTYEAYKKNKAKKLYACNSSNESFDERQSDNFTFPPLTPLQKAFQKSFITEKDQPDLESYSFDDSYVDDSSDNNDDLGLTSMASIEKKHVSNHEAEQFCLYLLSSLLIDKYYYGPLHDVLINLSVKLMQTSVCKLDEQRIIAIKCQELLRQINQLPEDSFSASYSNAQIITWGLKIKGNTFDLRNSDLQYVLDEDKWNALAMAYKLSGKETITMDVFTLCLIQSFYLESMSDSLARIKAKANALHLNHGFYQHIPSEILPSLGHLLQKMEIKILDLSHNSLYEQSDIHWWQTFSTMLKNARIQELKLSQNQMYKMSDSLWLSFCENIALSGLRVIHIDDLGQSRQIMLQKYLTKGTSYSGTFFQDISIKTNKPTPSFADEPGWNHNFYNSSSS